VDPVSLFQARWIYPVSRPPIEGGMVAVREGKIVAVGPKNDLAPFFLGRMRDLGDGVILPGLVNAHTHLELSALRGRLSPGSGFLPWVRRLLDLRERLTAAEQSAAAAQAREEMVRTGTGAFIDWSIDPGAGPEDPSPPLIRKTFLEVIGFNQVDLVLPGYWQDRAAVGWSEAGLSLGAHAPHSTSAFLLKAGKAWTRARGLPLAVHTAESPEEREFLVSGNGAWKDFLMERGKWLAGWKAPGCSAVEYLDRLGVLAEGTCCIHLSWAEQEDLALLRQRQAGIVVCPRSNRFITGALPDLPFMVKVGLQPALGTDSLASNEDLSLWGEMALLQSTFSGISPTEIIKMATLNGALTLGLSDSLGSISPGKMAKLFFLPLPGRTVKDLGQAVVDSRGEGLSWIVEESN
jgi:aminodeoxyfutalosine deaminase